MIFKQFDDVCIPIPRTLTDCIVLIKSDMYRYCGYSSKSKIWREVLINPSFLLLLCSGLGYLLSSGLVILLLK